MGNIFEQQTHHFYQRDKQSLYVPPILEILLSRCFKSPGHLFGCFKRAFEEDLLFTFLLRKEEFIKFAGKYFGFNIPQTSTLQQSQENSMMRQNHQGGQDNFLAAIKTSMKKDAQKGAVAETQNNLGTNTTEGDEQPLEAQMQNDLNADEAANQDDEDLGEIPLAKKIFKIFKVDNQTQGYKVINMLELFTALILLADFSAHSEEIKPPVQNPTNVLAINQEFECRIDDQSIEIAAEKNQAQNDLIEHKVNLMITLFSFRENQTLNISEIIIMSKTALRSLQRVFPAAQFFQNQKLFEEIRTLMISLFRKRIEDKLKQEKSIQGAAAKSKIPKGPVEGASWKKGSVPSEMNPNLGFTTPNAPSSNHKRRGSDGETDTESIEDKKERLFKWNVFQTVKFTQDSIKETLIQNINVLRFLNLLESFDNTVMAWGSNNCLQFGLHLKRDLQKYYLSQIQLSKSTDTRIQQELILQQVVNLKNHMNEQQSSTQFGDLDIKNLLSMWQNTFTNAQNSGIINGDTGKAYSRYERKLYYNEPQFMFSLLNTQIMGIYPNDKFTIYQSQEGVLFSTGQDFREVSREDLFGIPRELKISGLVKQISVGLDHALILTESYRVYAMGSNIYGQLGVNRNTGLAYHLHPLTKQKLYFAQQPMEIAFFSQGPSAQEETLLNIHIKQVGCGDCFSVAVSSKGEVYTWGMGTQGQLGITLRKGMISNMIDSNGIQYSRAVQQVKSFDKDPIEQVFVGAKHTFALSIHGNYYFWGYNHSGLALLLSKRSIDQPIMIPSLQRYGFTDMVTSHDHVLALGPSIELTLNVGDQVLDNSLKMQVNAYHVHSDKQFNSREDLVKLIGAVRLEPVTFLNDFDIPYLNLSRNKFPIFRKNKRKRYNQEAKQVDDDDEEEDDGDNDEDDEENEGDDDEDGDDGSPSPGGGDDDDEEEGAGDGEEDGEGNASKAKGDDDEDEEENEGDDDEDTSAKKKKNKSAKKGKKKAKIDDDEAQVEEKPKKKKKDPKKKAKKTKKKKEVDESYVPNPLIKQLSAEEQRIKKMNDYIKNLNIRKNYFRDIEAKIPPAILEANENDEDNELYGAPLPTPFNEIKKSEPNASKKSGKAEKQKIEKPDTKKKVVVKEEEDDEDEEEDEEEKEEEEDEKDEDDDQSDEEGEDDEDGDEEGSDEEGESPGSGDEDDDDDEESDEDIYIKQERDYTVKSEPIEVNTKKLQKMILPEYLTKSKLLFTNFMAADYQYTLKKLLSIVERIYENLKFLIISLPPGASSVDPYYAKLLCQEFELRGGSLQVLFINDDKKQEVIDKIFARDKKHFRQIHTQVSMSMAISDASLIYSWGSARKGKLGLSDSYGELKTYSNFYTECLNLCAQQDYMDEENGEQTDMQTSFTHNTFDSSVSATNIGVNPYHHQGVRENLFAIRPQPIMSLLGEKIKQIAVGREHCLVITASGQVYSWGDNSKHQVGLQKEATQEEVEIQAQKLSGLKKASNPQQQTSQSKHQTDTSSINLDLSVDKGDKMSLEKQQQQLNQENDLSMFKNVIGVPRHVSSIKAKVNFVACGHYQSYASLKLM